MNLMLNFKNFAVVFSLVSAIFSINILQCKCKPFWSHHIKLSWPDLDHCVKEGSIKPAAAVAYVPPLINKGFLPEREFAPQSIMSSSRSLLGERGLNSVWWESLQLCSWWQPVLWDRPK